MRLIYELVNYNKETYSNLRGIVIRVNNVREVAS